MNIRKETRTLPAQGFAEKREVAPKVAILDDFDLDPDGFPHGQAVESVLFSNSDLNDSDVQRVQNTPKQADFTSLMKDEKLGFRGAYQTLVSRNLAHFYLGTAMNLQQILEEQPDVKVINQSQGETAGRQLELVFNKLNEDTEFRSHVGQAFGLEPGAKLAKVCEVMLRDADRIALENEVVQKAQEQYTRASKAVHDKGITYLVASGNHGPIGDVLKSIGAEASNTAFRNILANDYTTIVGSNAPDGSPSSGNSPTAAIEVLRRGDELSWEAKEFDMEGVTSGSSFATPVAAAEALEFLEANPKAGPFEVESFLKGIDSYRAKVGETLETKNGQILEADGKLDPYIAEQMGVGFLTDVQSPDAAQIAQASRDRTFFGLPGQEDHEFQLVKMRPDLDGNRHLTIETFFTEGHHVLRAVAKDGAWDPQSVVEELHLDAKRQKEIEERKKSLG